MRAETLTLVLVNLAGIMERADESLLPGVYKEVGEALHTGPAGLGALSLFRSMVQSLCYPLAAYLAVRYNRAHVIAYGALLWSAATFLVGFSSSYFEVAVSRALNGIGLAIVTPSIQSLVADSTDDQHRGTAFGWLQVTSNLGSVLGGLFSLLIAPITFLGIPGWRVSFHIVGIISVVVGLLVRFYARDPHFRDGSAGASSKVPAKPFMTEVKDLIQEAKMVIGIRSFQILMAQGVTGSFPWSSMSFAPMWLELIGFSHTKTAIVMGMSIIGNSLGGLFGGMMGDVLSMKLPNSGRIILAQISSGSAIPLTAVLLLGLPYNPSATFLYGLVMLISGFFISWNAPATNNPIFAEIVPEKSRTSIYALDRFFESVLSSFAPPVVGVLAQHVYGYKPVPEGSEHIATDRENARSLAEALYTAIGVPMALCCFIYFFLYKTYPRDRDRARMQALIESEVQLMESNVSPRRRKSPLLESSDPGELFDDMTIIEMSYGGDELDFDDDDEKASILRTSKLSSSTE